ncbi:hypothetical protein Tco_0874788 [Tanacetum coccineum]|uniref:Uncharacterized protein n=1 Tax=Tanacetum coccineum TaxID=301880 RepID=A0ABQ5BQH0_9ASTR
MAVAKGIVVGLEKDTDRDGFVLIRVQGIHNPLRVNITTIELVTSGLAVGNWVHLLDYNRNHSSIGILHSIDRDGSVTLGFIGLETLWKGRCSQLQMADPFSVGQFVMLKGNVLTPRFLWLHKREGIWATGKVVRILPNGCLVLQFLGKLLVKQRIEDHHWAVRPLMVACGVLMAVNFGFIVGHNMGSRLKKGRGSRTHGGFCWYLSTLPGDDIKAYNNRFHELVLMCPELVPTGKKKIERYVRGFPERIKETSHFFKSCGPLHEAFNRAPLNCSSKQFRILEVQGEIEAEWILVSLACIQISITVCPSEMLDCRNQLKETSREGFYSTKSSPWGGGSTRASLSRRKMVR